jgi:hypothetical protein
MQIGGGKYLVNSYRRLEVGAAVRLAYYKVAPPGLWEVVPSSIAEVRLTSSYYHPAGPINVRPLTSAIPMEVSGDDIAETVQKQFEKLPAKRKPQRRGDDVQEWTPLSGIVAQGDPSYSHGQPLL